MTDNTTTRQKKERKTEESESKHSKKEDEREEIKRKEKEKEIEEMNRIILQSNLKKTGEDEVEKKKIFVDEDAQWVNVSSNCFNSTSIEIHVSFQKDCNLPKDENKRSLQVTTV